METFCRLPPSKEEVSELVHLYEKKIMKNASERFSKKIISFFKEILPNTSTLILQKNLASYGVGLYLKLASCLVCLVICLLKYFIK